MITYEIERDTRLVVSRVSGGLGVLEVADFLQTLVRDPQFDPAMNSLIIAEDTASVPRFSMLHYLNPLVAAWTARRGRARWAFVLPNEVTRVLAETELKHLTLNQVQAQCFTDASLAREWLMSAPAAERLAAAPKPAGQPAALTATEPVRRARRA